MVWQALKRKEKRGGDEMAYQEKVVDLCDVVEVQKYVNGRLGTKEQRKRAEAR